jgi:hypothetical protein
MMAGEFLLIPLAVYSISPSIHFLLLGLWVPPWILVGYVVLTLAAKAKQAILVQQGAIAKH